MGSLQGVTEGPCIEWSGRRTPKGYGVIDVPTPERGSRGRPLGAHRFMYELLVGPIPAGLELDHLCANRACVNVLHLQPVTHRENLRRGSGFAGVNARKAACKRGHPFTEANTRIRPGRGRECRACQRAHDSKRLNGWERARRKSPYLRA